MKDKIFKGVKWTTISTIFVTGILLLKISILTRILEKEDFGLLAIAMFIMGFMDLFNDIGITSAILHKKKISQKEYSSLFWLNMIMGFSLYFVLLLITNPISSFYNLESLKIIIPIIGLNLIISSLGRIYKTIEIKELRFKEISIIEIIASFTSLIAAIYLAVKGYGVMSLIYSAVLQYLINNILFFAIGYKKNRILFRLKFKETISFLKIGSYQMGSQIVNYFNRDIDILIIGKFFSPEILGSYSLAKQLVFRPAQIINPIILKVATPYLSKLQDSKESLKVNYLKIVNILSSMNVPIYLFLILFSNLIIRLLYGEGYENINSLVKVLSIYMIFRSFGNPVGSLVIATGKTKLEFYWNILLLFIFPTTIYIASSFSIIVVAISITISMILLYVPSWKILINNLTGTSLKDYIFACFKLNYQFLKRW